MVISWLSPLQPLSSCLGVSSSLTLTLTLTLTLALASIILGVYCGHIFFQSGYIQYTIQGSAHWSTSYGYTHQEFAALVFHALLLPLGLASSVVFGMQFFKSEAPSSWKMGIFSSVAALLIYAVAKSAYDAQAILGCGIIFCSGEQLSGPLGYFGAAYTFDLMYFFVGLMFLMATMVLIAKLGRAKFLGEQNISAWDYSLLSTTDGENKSNSMYSEKMQKRHEYSINSSKKLQLIGVLLCFAVLYPLLFFACMSLPNGWKGFTKYYIRKFQSGSLSANSPDYVGSVINIKLSTHLTLKLFGDVFAFYLFIYSTVITAFLAHIFDGFRKCLHFRPPLMFGFTVGELSMWVLFSVLMAYEFCYWYYHHGWESKSISHYTSVERAARTLGQLANVTMGLLVLPVARNSVWSIVFGVSWEAMIRFHRWLGNLFLAIVVCHICCWAKVFSDEDLKISDIVHVPSEYHMDNFTIPLTIVMTVVMFPLMGLLSRDFVRRKYFELFFYAHHFFLVVFITVLWHAASSWYYIVAGLSLWAMDHLLRFIRVASAVKVHTLSAITPEVTELSFTIENGGRGPFGGRCTSISHQMGQFAFINVPAVSHMEWHPFTISSAPQDTISSFHIKSMGPDTFTGKLHIIALQQETQQLEDSASAVLTVNIDGPYGMPLDYTKYTHLLFVAGGIGVTPCMSYFKGLYFLSKHTSLNSTVRLLWACREASMLQIFEPTLASIVSDSNDGKFSCAAHLTHSPVPGHNLSSSTHPKLELKEGRPDLEKEIASIAAFGSSTLVFVCGPSALKAACERLTLKYGIDIHAETFEL